MEKTKKYGNNDLLEHMRLPGKMAGSAVGPVVYLAVVAGTTQRLYFSPPVDGLRMTVKDFGVVVVTAPDEGITLKWGLITNGVADDDYFAGPITLASGTAAGTELSRSQDSTNYDWNATADDEDSERVMSPGDVAFVDVTVPAGTTGIIAPWLEAHYSSAKRGAVVTSVV